jgi:dihydropteroate synthase
MLALVAERRCGYVLMHIEGPPRVDRERPDLGDPVEHLLEWFGNRLERAAELGVETERIALDPGFDFDLGVDDDLDLLRRLGELRSLGRPLFVALSRKDFLGAVLAGSWEARLEPERREAATLAVTALAVAQGAEVLRLHDQTALDALRTAAAIAVPIAQRSEAEVRRC